MQEFGLSEIIPLICNSAPWGFDLWVGKIHWRRERLPIPVFWPGEFHELYGPWDCNESDRIEQLSLHFTSLGPVSCVFTSWVSSGLTIGSGYRLMAARWQVFFPFSALFLRAQQLRLEGCNRWWLWHPLFTDMAISYLSPSFPIFLVLKWFYYRWCLWKLKLPW